MFQKVTNFIEKTAVMSAPLPASLISGIFTTAKFNLTIRESPNQLLRIQAISCTEDLCQSINQPNRLSGLTPKHYGPFVLGQSKAKKKITFRAARTAPKKHNIRRVLECIHLWARKRCPSRIVKVLQDLPLQLLEFIGIQAL
jgi:hypothetical protein